ncbi:MAG TPA: hypothetical protein VGE21_08015 [Flavobacteriales bacterium]
MGKRYTLATLLVIASIGLKAQCSVDFPSDTMTVYWGYEPLSCVTLAPEVVGESPSMVAWSTADTAAALIVCDTVSTWYYAALTDGTGCTAIDSAFVRVVDVRCGNANSKVLVCHVPPGNPANAHTICISPNGVPAHLAHGCFLGPCSMEADTIAEGMALLVTPNPLENESMVILQSSTDQRVNVRAVDALGRTLFVLLDAEVDSSNPRMFTLNRTSIPAGLSMVWLVAEGQEERVVRPVIVTRP